MFIYEKAHVTEYDSEGFPVPEKTYEALNFVFGKGNQIPADAYKDSEGNPMQADVIIYNIPEFDSEGVEIPLAGETQIVVNGEDIAVAE